MKAAICKKYGSPDVLEIAEVPTPSISTRGLLVKIIATAVTSSDCYIRGFAVPWHLKPLMGLVIGFSKPRQPILGVVFSGIVEAVGKKVSMFSVGDEVFGFDRFGFGCHAEYKAIRENGVIAHKPSGLNHIDAAAIPYGGSLALYYLKKFLSENHKHILVVGASGSVGSSAVQLLKVYGKTVTGVCSTSNVKFVNQLGADRVIDYKNEDLSACREKFDFIFDAVPHGAGKTRTNKIAVTLLNANGVYASVTKGTPQFSVQELEYLGNLYAEGKVKPVIDRIMTLEEISEAHKYVETWRKRGNLIIKVQET